MPMQCNDIQDLLGAYLDSGIADADTRAAIENHLEGCPICRAERDSLAGTLAHVAPAIKAAGDAIAIPDVQWQGMPTRTATQTRMRPFFGAKESAYPSAYSNNHNGRKPLMQDPKVPTTGRRSPLAGLLTFIISLAVLFVGWLIFNASMRSGVGVSQEQTETPTATPEAQVEVATAEPTATPLPTDTPLPTVDPLTITGGFVDNQVDVSTLPEYEVTGGGGGGGGGGGPCPEADPADSALLIDHSFDPSSWGHKQLCVYGLPTLAEDVQFTIALISPSGKRYERGFSVAVNPTESGWQILPHQASMFDNVSIDEEVSRTPIDLTVYFPAAQEYGVWQVTAVTYDGVQFASDEVLVETQFPIYSIVPLNNPNIPDPLNPFYEPITWTWVFVPQDHALFAGQGLEAGKETILALYSYDPERTNDSVTIMIPYYATRITVDAEGTFRSEFVVGSETFGTQTNGAYFSAVFDPQPGEFKPEQFGFTVNP